MDQFPNIPYELLKELEQRFPELSPMRGETIEDLMFRGGQRSVIQFLAEKFREQNETVLTNVLSKGAKE